MKRFTDIISHTILIFGKKHLPYSKRVALWFAYIRVTSKRFFLGRLPGIDSTTAAFLGFKIEVGVFSDFYWTFIEIFINEDYYFKTDKQSPLVIDCGSNIGINILYVKWLYPGANLIAFEMEPDNIHILENNIKRNKLSNIKLNTQAVGDTPGEMMLYGNRRAGTISEKLLNEQIKKDISYKENHIKIDVVRLSDYITGPVDFLKMDIEGAESAVFMDLGRSGAMNLIEYVTLEFHRFSSDENKLSTIMKVLEDANFDVVFPNNFSALTDLNRSYYNYMVRAGKRHWKETQ